MSAIRFKDFSAYYSYKKELLVAVDNITLEIPDGKITVLLGPSGCGKSTILKCITGGVLYTEGELTIDGEKVGDKLRHNIGYVAQEYSLYPHLTAFENIAYPLRLMHTPYEEIQRRVKEVAKQLDIEILLTRKPKYLSGGQQQRVAIARAIVRKPNIILFDEPFSNLEAPLRASMQQLVKNLHKELGCTFVFVTHDLREAFSIAEELIIVNEGCIVQQGTVAEVRSNPQTEFVKEFLHL